MIIVERATLATTIMPVEAANPPMKTNSASTAFPLLSGSSMTIRSAGVEAGSTAIPASTIGTMTSEVTTR